MTTAISRVKTVRSQGKVLRAPMSRAALNTFIQNVDAQLVDPEMPDASVIIPGGIFWVGNRQTEEETNGRTSYARYKSAYDVLRAGRIIDTSYGGSTAEAGSEVTVLRADIQQARSFMRFVLAMGLYTEEERKAILSSQAALVREYETKRNQRKVTACERFRRGMHLHDSRGRRNTSAMALVTGASISHLHERMAEIRRIGARVDSRTLEVFDFIQEHIGLYEELRFALKTARKAIARGFDSTARHAVHRELASFASAFSAVRALPFRRFAEQTVKDLAETLRLLRISASAASIDKQICQSREGILRALALHHLQMEIISPLSLLLHDLVRQIRSDRRLTSERRARILITKEMAHLRFELVYSQIRSFMDRLRTSTDRGYTSPAITKASELALEAHTQFVCSEYFKAKKTLLKIAEILTLAEAT